MINNKIKFFNLSNLFNYNFRNLKEIIFSLNDAYTFNKKCKRNFKIKII